MTICISFISQKGGVGKSTLARALAREANNQELTVKVADLDTHRFWKFFSPLFNAIIND